MYVYPTHTGAFRGQERISGALKLELQVVVSLLTWVLWVLCMSS